VIKGAGFKNPVVARHRASYDPLVDQPDWASIKSANATYSAMVAAWCAAVTTALGMFAAIRAVIWAKRAAQAAQEQPVLLLTATYIIGARPRFTISATNYGDDLAFDIELENLQFEYERSAGRQTPSMGFRGCAVLRANDKYEFGVSNPPAIADMPRDWAIRGDTLIDGFMNTMIDEALKGVGGQLTFRCGVLKLKWRSVRGQHFSQDYELIANDKREVESKPIGSLIRSED
jgi:hypothetical protein